MISHPDNPLYPIDYEAFVKETGRLNKIVELNEHSIWYRLNRGAKKNALEYLELCKRHNVRIAVSSDAHICLNVGVCDTAVAVLGEADFPHELIVNLTKERFERYLEERSENKVLALI